jgi:hypothetical protein
MYILLKSKKSIVIKINNYKENERTSQKVKKEKGRLKL